MLLFSYHLLKKHAECVEWKKFNFLKASLMALLDLEIASMEILSSLKLKLLVKLKQLHLQQ
jgi:hypothetical protein